MRITLLHPFLGVVLVAGLSNYSVAGTLCVNQGGTSGCYSKISDAVAAATNHDTIAVAHGTDAEDVQIGKPLSLVGQNSQNTIIDASGLSNGIYVDGLDHPGLSSVVITGFTVKNANFEGPGHERVRCHDLGQQSDRE